MADYTKKLYIAGTDIIDIIKSEKAESAKVADSATKATQDASGNVITSTYATKSEVTSGLAGKQPTGDYATNTQLTQGLAGKASASHMHTADQVTGLATVATSGSYSDLSDKPVIPAAQVNADWNAESGVAQILNKPTIPSTDALIPKSGSAGMISCYETSQVYDMTSTANQELTIAESSPATIVFDSTGATSASSIVTLTFTPADESVNTIKVLSFKNGSFTMGLILNGAIWANGADAPAFGSKKNSILTIGAHFIAGRVYLWVHNQIDGEGNATSSGGGGGN